MLIKQILQMNYLWLFPKTLLNFSSEQDHLHSKRHREMTTGVCSKTVESEKQIHPCFLSSTWLSTEPADVQGLQGNAHTSNTKLSPRTPGAHRKGRLLVFLNPRVYDWFGKPPLKTSKRHYTARASPLPAQKAGGWLSGDTHREVGWGLVLQEFF